MYIHIDGIGDVCLAWSCSITIKQKHTVLTCSNLFASVCALVKMCKPSNKPCPSFPLIRHANIKNHIKQAICASRKLCYAIHPLERLFAVFCYAHPIPIITIPVKPSPSPLHTQQHLHPSRTILHHPTRTTTPPLMLHISPAPRTPPPNRLPLPAPRRIRRSRSRTRKRRSRHRRHITPPRTHRQPITPIPRRRRHHTATARTTLRATRRRPHRATPADFLLLRLFDPARVAGEVPHWIDAGADRTGPLVWVKGFGDIDWSDGGAERSFRAAGGGRRHV